MDELIAMLIGTVATVVGSISTLAYWLDRKLTTIEFRFKDVDRRFESIEERFGNIDGKFKEMEGNMDRRLREVEGRIVDRINRIGEAFIGYQEFFIEYLTSERVIKELATPMLKGEIRRLMRLALINPFTKEEVKRLEEFIDKDELNLDEALELRELARKAVKEYGQYPEAWKLHLYSSIMVGLARRKMLERGV